MTKRGFFAGVLIAIALPLGWLAFRQWQAQSWLPVEGELVGVRTTTGVTPPLDGKWGSIPPHKSEVHWIDYSYTVDGRRHTGEAEVTPLGDSGLTVYYDPDHPERSRLDRPKAYPLVALFAALLFLWGVVVGVGGSRRRAVSA